MNQKEIERTVREIPLFSRLGDDQVKQLAKHAVISDFSKKSTFFSEDSSSQGLHVLISGKIKLFKVSEEGKEQTIFVFDPGEPFCLCSVFSDGILPANLGAIEDSKVLIISPEEFEKLVMEDPTILIKIMQVMSRRLKDAMEMIDSLSLKQVPARLAAYFLSRAEKGIVNLDISYRELSKIIGITPEALSRAMKNMSKNGLIKVHGTEIKITDSEAINRYSEGSIL